MLQLIWLKVYLSLCIYPATCRRNYTGCRYKCIQFKILIPMGNYLAGRVLHLNSDSYRCVLVSALSISRAPMRLWIASTIKRCFKNFQIQYKYKCCKWARCSPLSTMQNRTFVLVGPTSMNSLLNMPWHELLGLIISLFCKHLKTYLFSPGFL